MSTTATPRPLPLSPRVQPALLAARLEAAVQAVDALVVTGDGPEGALALAHAGGEPVLAVGVEADGTLRRAVVAVDFGPASVRAAALACRLLAPGGTLSLVHVKPRPELGHEAWDAWDGARDRRLGELFRRLVVALRGTAGDASGRRDVTIGTAILVGDAAEERVEYAARVGAELLAVGTHGSRGGRLLAGSVVGELARRAGVELPECSVLLAPAPGEAAPGAVARAG